MNAPRFQIDVRSTARRANLRALLRVDRLRLARFQRRGLAPLEFVLWLPVLLFVMALMVNYGTSAAWRLRGEVVSRDSVWRTRFPRNSGGEPAPPPPVWPVGATMGVAGDAPLTSADDPFINHAVVRGPLPNGYVVRDTLDPQRGAVHGSAGIVRPMPLLPRAGMLNTGDIKNPMLHGTWTNSEFGIPNFHRRVPSLYQLPTVDRSLPDAFGQAVRAVFAMTNFNGLRVLDRDPDWIEYRGAAPDFHPRVNPLRCTLDRAEVQRREVDRLIDVWDPARAKWRLGAISRLPRSLTSAFLAMYKQTKAAFEAELRAMPPPPPDRVAYINSQLPHIEQSINQLELFQDRIGDFEKTLTDRGPPTAP